MARHRPLRRTTAAPLAVLTVASLFLAACGNDDGDVASGQGGGGEVALTVKAAFYPLHFVAERVGGELAEVSTITPPGADAHDVELTPRDVASLEDADLLLYLAEFQPSVDAAVESAGAETFDVTGSADLEPTFDGDGHDDDGDDHGHDDEAGHDDDGDGHDDDGDDHGPGAADPHFWLDPTRLGAVAADVAERFAELDPDNADTYRANAEALGSDLDELDAELEAGLADCENDLVVTNHESFGYLADRYGLDQVGISGLSPSEAPSPRAQAEIADFVADEGVRTIYYETSVSPDVAQAVADEAGAATAVLDPLESLTDDSEGADYLEVMRSNLSNLQEGQPCR
jgi:zinc transport system substrate-binding protein